MPYKAARLERAYRIAPVRVQLINDAGGLDDVTLNVKYRPLSLKKLEEWEATEAKHAQPPENGSGTKESVEMSEAEKAAEERREREEERREKTILAFQLSDDVVFDLDLVEDDGLTPKKVTFDYLLTLDLGFLKDIKREIEGRAFPEKKEMLDLMRSKVS